MPMDCKLIQVKQKERDFERQFLIVWGIEITAFGDRLKRRAKIKTDFDKNWLPFVTNFIDLL